MHELFTDELRKCPFFKFLDFVSENVKVFQQFIPKCEGFFISSKTSLVASCHSKVELNERIRKSSSIFPMRNYKFPSKIDCFHIYNVDMA